VARYLADTSAWNRSAATEVAATRWRKLLRSNDVAIAPPVALELLYSARSARDYHAVSSQLEALPFLGLDARAAAVAQDTQARLAERSQHRGPTPVDLLVAAIADLNGVTLLHHDRHFDAISRVTGQPMEWLPKRGTVP
jgi:predicted nucleic acid-binding protein